MLPRRIAMLSYHTCPLALEEGKETGGMNVYVLELAKELGRQGIAVDAFTRSQDPSQPYVVEVSPLFRVIHLPAGPEAGIPKKELVQFVPEFVDNYFKFLGREGIEYDLLHGHYYMSGLVGEEINRRSEKKLPMVMNFHTLALMKNLVARDEQERDGQERIDAEMQLVHSAAAILAPSESDQQYLQYLYQADLAKVEVIPPGVDLVNFKPMDKSAAKARIGIKDNDKIILFCGRIEPLKGIDMLLYAMKVLVERQPDLDVCLWIVGGDVSLKPESWSRELRRLERLRHQLKLTTVVHFAGQQSQEALPAFYNAAEVVVLPSHYESFGMAAAEAMACGVPVITTNVAGISSLIDDKHQSLIASVNNPLLLATQIETLLSDEIKKHHLSQDVLNRVQDLKWENVAKRIVEVYSKSL